MTDEEKQLWAIAIGEFIIEFGSMESLVTEVLRKSFIDAHFEVLRKLPFEKRSSLAFATLQKLNPSLADNLASELKVLEAIRIRRNVVAHSGFVAEIYTNEDQTEFKIEFGMSDAYKKNAVVLQIQHLEADTESLKSIYSRLLPLVPSSTPNTEHGVSGEQQN